MEYMCDSNCSVIKTTVTDIHHVLLLDQNETMLVSKPKWIEFMLDQC